MPCSRNENSRQRLAEISRRYEIQRSYRDSEGRVRHKCFISYHSEDAEEIASFVESFEDVFIPRAVGLSDDDPLIDSDDADYIVDTIRDKYLRDSTVTIVMVGRCTWSRRFIDAEIFSSLRAGKINRINGLMAIELPAAAGNTKLPERVKDNYVKDGESYAKYWKYPGSKTLLKSYIEKAFDARENQKHLIDNRRARRKRSTKCP